MKKIGKNTKLYLIGMIIGGITLGITTVIADTIINSTSVAYKTTTVKAALDELYDIADFKEEVKDMLYPVGSIYISVSSTNPSELFGGTWITFGEGKTLVGFNSTDTDFNEVEKIGGNKNHQHLYGLQYGAFRRDTVLEGNINAGLLNYTDESNFSLTGQGTWAGQYEITVNSVTESSASSTGSPAYAIHNRMTASTSTKSSLQPYITVYMWKRTA